MEADTDDRARAGIARMLGGQANTTQRGTSTGGSVSWARGRGAGLRAVVLAGAMILGAMVGGCSREAPRGGPLDVVVGFGESGNAPGQFGYPRAIDREPGTRGGADSLWVIDKLARVQRLDAKTGKAIEAWRMPKLDNGKPTGVTVWGGGAMSPALLFVADTHEHRVVVFAIRPRPTSVGALAEHEVVTDRPEMVATFGSYGEGPGELVYPTDVCIVPTDDGASIARVLVSEYGGNDRINIWEPVPGGSSGGNHPLASWRYVRSFGTFGNSASKDNVQFSRPQTMSLSEDGSQLLIADSCNHRIGVFTLDGELVRWIATRGPGKEAGHVTYPYAIVPLGDGTIMVAEFGNNRLQRLDVQTGVSLGLFGQAGRGNGQLSTPWAMTRVDDLLYVLDSGNSRVLAMDVPKGRPEALTPELAHATGNGGTTGGGR